jgi:hypothetical protein
VTAARPYIQKLRKSRPTASVVPSRGIAPVRSIVNAQATIVIANSAAPGLFGHSPRKCPKFFKDR